MASPFGINVRSTLRALFQSIKNTSDAPIVSRKAVRSLSLSGGITAGDQIERAVLAEARRALALEPAPLHGKILKQPGEELRPRANERRCR